MRRTILTITMGAAMVIAPAAATAANQGDSGKVLELFVNPSVKCADGPVEQPKVEVESGKTLTLTSEAAIYSVSIKSGSKAAVESEVWTAPNSVTITLTQDWSNYVVSTCTAEGPISET